MRLHRILPICLLLLMAAFSAQAQQGLFAPQVIVNDKAITRFEVGQRALFLKLLRAPGDVEAEAVTRLVEDRLRLEAGARLGLSVSEEALLAGMEEFAGRAQLSVEEFLKAIAQGGVEPETFRDFVRAGLIWRDVVRTRFGDRVAITEADIDRALALTSQRGAVRLLLSELILPATPDVAAESEALALRLSASLRGEADFAAAARQYSVAPTRDQGGRIDWVPLANLPPQIGPVLLALEPGQVSPPFPVPNAIALFLLRAVEQVEDLPASAVSVDYAQFLIAGGRSAEALAEAAAVRARVDQCNDLYAVARGLPPEQLQRDVLSMDQVPGDIALELAKLDEGESSVALVRGNALVFLMLCKRELVAEAPPSRDSVRTQLINQQLSGMAEHYLAELMAEATIVAP